MKKSGMTVMNLIWMALALTLIALGIALFFVSNIGSNPFATLIEGLMVVSKLSFGTINILSNMVFLAISFKTARRYFGLGTILNMFLVGYLVDGWLFLFNHYVVTEGLLLQLAISIAATIVLGFGIALYMYVDQGYGSYEMLMETIVVKTQWPVAVARTVQEVTVLVAGVLLGGRFGLGTLINAAVTGSLLAFFYKHIEKILGKKE